MLLCDFTLVHRFSVQQPTYTYITTYLYHLPLSTGARHSVTNPVVSVLVLFGLFSRAIGICGQTSSVSVLLGNVAAVECTAYVHQPSSSLPGARYTSSRHCYVTKKEIIIFSMPPTRHVILLKQNDDSSFLNHIFSAYICTKDCEKKNFGTRWSTHF